jgi:hypothetical protein
MIDAEVAAWLAKNIRPGPDFRLLVVGDEHQLPSVGHGRVLADLLAADVISVSRLRIVQRQATGSRIVQQAHRILERQPLLVGDNARLDGRAIAGRGRGGAGRGDSSGPAGPPRGGDFHPAARPRLRSAA